MSSGPPSQFGKIQGTRSWLAARWAQKRARRSAACRGRAPNPRFGGTLAESADRPTYADHSRPAGVMEQAVEHGGDGGRIDEELAPVLDGTIRNEQRRGPLVAAHHLKSGQTWTGQNRPRRERSSCVL